LFKLPRPLAFGTALVAETAAALTRKPPIFDRDRFRELSAASWACCIARSKHELGYQPRVPIAQGLRETIEWYKGQRWL
jgi:nucleoside-diphosphate-sugar epimerase